MNGWGWFFLILLLIVLAFGGWCGFRFFSAKRQGLPPPPLKAYIPFMKTNANANYPTPRSSGPLDWIKDQISKLRNTRTARGAYEETGGTQRGLTGRRGRGLEDDAWDTRVGNEDPYGQGPGAYYNEEQELGLAATPGYATEPYGRGGDYLSTNTGYNAGGGGGSSSRGQRDDLDNPFGDENQAPSLRSVSPRPQVDTGKAHKKDNNSIDSGGDSPASVRKSVFREGI